MSSSYPPTMPSYGPFLYVPPSVTFNDYLTPSHSDRKSMTHLLSPDDSLPCTLSAHDAYPMPSPQHHSQPSPTIPGSYPQPHVIHVIHHSAHHSPHDTKKKAKAKSGSVERGRQSPHLHSHKLPHSYSTSQLNLPSPIPFPKASSHSSSHHPHHYQKSPSQPNTPAHVHYTDLPAVSFERKSSTSNVLQKRRPSISLSSTQQIIHPQLTPLSPNPLQLPAPQKPLHGILKNKNSIQQLPPLDAYFQYSRCTGRKKAVCVCGPYRTSFIFFPIPCRSA